MASDEAIEEIAAAVEKDMPEFASYLREKTFYLPDEPITPMGSQLQIGHLKNLNPDFFQRYYCWKNWDFYYLCST